MGRRRPLWLLIGAGGTLIVVLAVWLMLRVSSEGEGERDRAKSPEPPTAPATLNPEDQCILDVMEIVAAGLNDQALNDGANRLEKMVFKYGASDPVFVAATQRVLPKAWLAAPTKGLDEAAAVAGEEAAIVCADPAVSGTDDGGPVVEPEESAPEQEEPSPPLDEPEVDCSEYDSTTCAEAVEVLEACGADASTIRLTEESGGGLRTWRYAADEGSRNAITTSEYPDGYVLSCGRQSNGIDVTSVYAEIERQATPLLGDVSMTVCRAYSPLDEEPVGSDVRCEAWNQEGNTLRLKVEVTAALPNFRVTVDN